MDRLGIDARRMGVALIAFGLVGVLVAGSVAVGLAGAAIAARNLDDRLATDQARVVAALERVDATLGRLVNTTANASTTLTTTSETLGSAGDVLAGLGDTAEELSTSIDISIFGSRPLAGAAARFGELAIQARTFQADAERLSGNLAVNAADVNGLADELALLRTELDSISERVAAFEATGEIVGLLVGATVLLAVLAGWLAVAGAFCAWLGLRLRRLGATAG
jgi:hypothetical protein